MEIPIGLNSKRIMRILMLGLLSAIGVAPMLAWADADKPKATESAVVRVEIDYGDGVEKHFTAIPWKAEMTVLDAMAAAKASPHGITFVSTGSGETTFISQIDDLKNEGARGGKRNWTFEVNGKLANRSAGVYGLKSADRVRWSYSPRKM